MFLAQHMHSLRNSHRGGWCWKLFWIGKEVGAFHTALLAPQTPRGIRCPLATAGDEAVPGSSIALSGASFLCSDTAAVTAALPGQGKGQRLCPQCPQGG